MTAQVWAPADKPRTHFVTYAFGDRRASLPDEGLIDEGAIATFIRIAEGAFRLLQQIGRVMQINTLDRVTEPVVEAARESVVIGTA